MRLLPALMTILFVCSAAQAQTPSQSPTQMPVNEHNAPGAADKPASKALMASMQHMNNDMNVTLTGNPDRDFVAMMIPHHQGAVDMAEVELRYGDDPQMRALAREIVAAQEKEIALMKRWQARHGEKHAQ